MLPPGPAEGVTVHVRILAEQFAVGPPFAPVQLHVHGPLPLTVVGVPELQRLVAGAIVNVPPFADPQTPFTIAAKFAVIFLAESIVMLWFCAPPSLQELKTYPLFAVALRDTLAPLSYQQPAEQLGFVLPLPTGFTEVVNLYWVVKLAVYVVEEAGAVIV